MAAADTMGILASEMDHVDGAAAAPLHVQRMEKALSLNPLLNYMENILHSAQSDLETSTDADTDLDLDQKPESDSEGNKTFNGIITSKAEIRADKTRLYNFSKVKKSRKWLKNILLSDSSSEDEDDGPITEEHLHDMLRMHKYQRKCQNEFYQDRELSQYQYYGVGLVSNYDKFYEHQKVILGPKKKLAREQKKLEKKMKAKLKKLKKEPKGMEGIEGGNIHGVRPDHIGSNGGRPQKIKKLTPEQIAAKRRKIWVSIAKKEIPKAHKQKASARKEMLSQHKKLAKDCQKECRRAAMQSQRIMRETPMRARRLSKEMMVYWKRFEKVEKEHRRKAEKEAQEQRKMDVELMEMKRQQRKLNFLITQTELYAHFMSRKMTGATDAAKNQILKRLDEEKPTNQVELEGGVVTDVAGDGYDSEETKALALRNAEKALATHNRKKNAYDKELASRHRRPSDMESSLANPAISTMPDRPQPTLFQGKLKGYQLKGMNWLANLYNQGINGILADEMGLGKTVQSVALLGHLAEEQNIWGPFLIVAPASTLHNWQQECSRFVPVFKVVPYWGNTQDRKILRKFWNQEHMHTQEASFHVVITSYQLVIQDVKYFQRIKWQYMVLDEAQALKSASSVRWKILLGFNCRNRLLLTGTPIQNSMAELWALLHFIMPTLFDSHEEFNEWFSKDIENHAEKQSGIDADQLSRLHMILKPFMLRRVKKDVENELSDKIEILVYCPLTTRQRLLYQGIKNKISIEDLLQTAAATSSQAAQTSTSSLMNLVMQFRKVCNHPELFERREVRCPNYMRLPDYWMPKLVYRDVYRPVPSKHHLLYSKLYIHDASYINTSLKGQDTEPYVSSAFSFLKFIDMSPAEMNNIMYKGLLVRWLAIFLWLKHAYRIYHRLEWHSGYLNSDKYIGHQGLLLSPHFTLSHPQLDASPHLRPLVYTSYTSAIYTHSSHTIHCMKETIGHRKIRLRKLLKSTVSKLASPPTSPTKTKPTSPTKIRRGSGQQVVMSPPILPEDDQLPPHPHISRPPRTLHHQTTAFPAFIYNSTPKMLTRLPDWFCSDRSAAWDNMKSSLCGTLEAKKSLLYGSQEIAEQVRWAKWYFRPTQPAGIMGLHNKHGYSGVFVPDKETLVTDAGKLYVLDTLLGRLKAEGHRVLIYSQMTRMIDILEEYMWHRKHTYMRLDGSSKISDRRDMVADFQTRSDIFVFLLSTRAGGLGINLTAADTVIFYDSDWNPTVDQQAMDRAHRLGQTKQVTVYRLICKGTIEERILQRAKEKSEIQRMVISGGNFRPDVLKPKEVVSLLLDDDDMEKKLKQKQCEKKTKEEKYKEKDRKRKRDKYQIEKGPRPEGYRGPGRPRKKRPEENNVTIPAPGQSFMLPGEDSLLDSAAASPQSAWSGITGGDESSNDGLVIVDDAHSTFPPVSGSANPPPAKRGRPRGRPRGSGVGRRPRGRGSVRKAIAAAELAGAEAGKSAAYAAYGYSYAGGGAGGSRSSSSTPGQSPGATPRASPQGFYKQRNAPS